jgi:predicted RNA-binding Zn-ribbon protein involved in translation (DUF1610 family)
MIIKEDLGKIKEITCSITNMSKPYLKIKASKWECPSCGNVISILQNKELENLREPKRCACGRKGGFRIISKDVIEAQEITIVEKAGFFEYKVYLEGKKLLDKVKLIKSEFTLKGEIQDEYKKKSSRGDFVIYAKDII